jgi:HEAT repeat protein
MLSMTSGEIGKKEARKPATRTAADVDVAPMLQIDPGMIDRLGEINTDLIARRELAQTKGWLGELEGIDLTLQFLQDKRADARRLAGLGPTNLGMPAIRP